jgi:CO/xanthine dehydrogenase Mo-binding subunit
LGLAQELDTVVHSSSFARDAWKVLLPLDEVPKARLAKCRLFCHLVDAEKEDKAAQLAAQAMPPIMVVRELPAATMTRVPIAFPPTDYNRIGTAFSSMCGTTVRVEIDRASGALSIAAAYSVVECGEALVPQIVLGQSQGGFAMGVGYALLEHLPPFEDGPGNGTWNLGRYLVARGSDLPLHALDIEVLPPLSRREPPKGMAEVVMIPVVPALLNAIADATGHRFQSLPVTLPMIKGVLA